MDKMNVSLIGCGYWGKNHLRVLDSLDEFNLVSVSDCGKPACKIPEGVDFTTDYDEILENEDVVGVVIATPTGSHYDLTRKALEAGLHVLVEKPLTTSSERGKELCDLAAEKGNTLMVGEIFRFNPAVDFIDDLISKGELGDLRYIESRRVGLGPVRNDVSALWDLATHDIYLSNMFVRDTPSSVSCQGISHNGALDDICCLNLKYDEQNVLSSIYVNWEHPIKERKVIIGGTKKAVLFDDVEPSKKISIYESGVDYQPTDNDFGSFQAAIRDGEIVIPKINLNQPLETELKEFALSYHRGITSPKSCGSRALETVKVLEAAEESRRNNGAEIRIK